MREEEKKGIREKIKKLKAYLETLKSDSKEDKLDRVETRDMIREMLEMLGEYEEGDKIAQESIREGTELLEELTEEEKKEIGDRLYKRVRNSYISRGRRHVDDFWIALEFDRKPENKFYVPRREKLKRIIEAHQELIDGKLDLLTVSQPKRTGKSQTSIGLVAMMIGRDIYGSILGAGEGTQLVDSFYKGVLELMTSEEYNYLEIFPEAKLVRTSAEGKMVDVGVEKRFASFTCRSIGGAVVGSTEANILLYLDDCVGGFEEAQNLVRLEKKWEVLKSDILGRRVDGCPILIAGTRYSVHDPIGKLQDFAEETGMRWRKIEIPAIDERTGESNWYYGERRGSLSRKYFEDNKKLVSAHVWASEFQQEPIESRGLLFPMERLNRYRVLPEGEADCILIGIDVAKGGGDSVSAPVGYVYGNNVYIEDVVFDNGVSSVTKPRLVDLILKHKPRVVVFESNNGGDEYGGNVKEKCYELEPKLRTSFRFKNTNSNKVTRICSCSDVILDNYYFKDEVGYGTDYHRFMKEVTTFVNLGKNVHDDAPDSLTILEQLVSDTIRNGQSISFGDRRKIGL